MSKTLAVAARVYCCAGYQSNTAQLVVCVISFDGLLDSRLLKRMLLADEGRDPSLSVAYSLLECPKARNTIEWYC